MGRKLLLADDSVTIQKVVDLTFADEGIEVTAFGDGESALAALEEIRPDIILADVFMPGLNGYQVCDSVKQNPAFRHIPVILLVGSFEPFDEEKARAAGADDYLTKPFQSIRQLVSKVNDLLGEEVTPGAEETLDRYHADLPDDETRTPETFVADEHGDLTVDSYSMPPANSSVEADFRLSPLPPTISHSSADAPIVSGLPAPDLDDETIEVTSLATPPSTENLSAYVAAAPPGQTLTDTDLVDTLGFNADETEINQRGEPHAATSDEEQPLDLLSAFASDAPDAVQTETARHVMPEPNFFDTHSLSADDGLLDLGEVEPPSLAAHDADEFVLDIDDELAGILPETESAEEFAPAAVNAEAESAETGDAAGDITPPTETDNEPLRPPRISEPKPLEWEPAPPMPTPIVGEAVQTGTGSVPVSETQFGGTISAAQLAPEAIDAIARRVIELMSNDIVREIAWEVVPDLADLHVRRRLEEERTRH